MKSILLLLSWAILMAGTCGDSGDNTTSFALGESFTLAPAEAASNKDADLRLSFIEILEDSRCPKNTNCVWEGQAKIKLMVNEKAMELVLRDGKPNEAQQLFNDSYIIEAKQLDPYPNGTKTDSASYRLQLMVSSR